MIFYFPCFSEGTTPRLEIYSSTDFTAFSLVPNWSFEGIGIISIYNVRDPSMYRHTDGYYYIVYTDFEEGTSALKQYVNMIRSKGPGHAWEWVQKIYTSGSYNYTWAPEWFVDPADGVIHVLWTSSATSTAFGNDRFKVYEMHPSTPGLLTGAWSSPLEIFSGSSPASYIDVYVLVKSGTYYMWLNDRRDNQNMVLASASSLTGTWTLIQTGNWTGIGNYCEGPSLVQMPSGAWRLYFDDTGGSILVGQISYTDSTDNWATWSTKAAVTGATGRKHGSAFYLPAGFIQTDPVAARVFGGILSNEAASAAGFALRASPRYGEMRFGMATFGGGATPPAPPAPPGYTLRPSSRLGEIRFGMVRFGMAGLGAPSGDVDVPDSVDDTEDLPTPTMLGYVDAGTFEDTEDLPAPTLVAIISVGTFEDTEDLPSPTFGTGIEVIASIEDVEDLPTPMLTKVEQETRLYLNGAYCSIQPQINTLQIRKRLGAPNEASFELWDVPMTLNLAPGSDVRIYRRNLLIFGGQVKDFGYYSHQATPGHRLQIRCEGYAALATYRSVWGVYDPALLADYGKSLAGIIFDLWVKFFVQQGEVLAFDEVNCPDFTITEKVEFINWEMFSVALDTLCGMANCEWLIDDDFVLRIKKSDAAIGDSPAPFNITQNDNRMSGMRVSLSFTDYANTFLLRSNIPLDGYNTDTFYGNSTYTQYFVTKFNPQPNDVPTIKLNGIPATLISFITPTPGSWQFSWNPGYGTFNPNPDLLPLSPSDVIEITYKAPASNVITYTDAAAVALQKTRQRGSGIREKIIDAGDRFADRATALLFLQNEAERYTKGTYSISYTGSETYPGTTFAQLVALQPGQVQNIDMTLPKIDDVDVLLDTISIKDVDGQYLVWDVTGTTGRAQSYWDKRLAIMLSKRTPRATAIDTYGWYLDHDDPEKINPGLKTTDYRFERVAQRDGYFNSFIVVSPNPPTTGYARIYVKIVSSVAGVGTKEFFQDYTAAQAGVPAKMQINVAVKQYDRVSIRTLLVGTPDYGGDTFNIELTLVPTGSNQNGGYQ